MSITERLTWLHFATSELAAAKGLVEQKFLLKRLVDETIQTLKEVDDELNKQREIDRQASRKSAQLFESE